jgi:hypothetical protein
MERTREDQKLCNDAEVLATVRALKKLSAENNTDLND